MTPTGTTTNPSSTDRIVKITVLRAPRSRVWRSLTDPREFSQWFGCDLKDPFVPGARVQGPITIPGYDHLRMDIVIDRVETERLFSYRWRPGGDPDNTSDPMTLVVFELEDVPEGTRLTLTESGFDQIPVSKRAKAYRENDQGWTGQMKNLAKHLA
jgi:uncharacterized protein YndB with AHSA1/START domain